MNDINILMERVQQINAKDAPDLAATDIDTLVNFYRYRRIRKVELGKSYDSNALDDIVPRPEVKVAPGAIRRFKKATP
jgi:hypothetical protein